MVPVRSDICYASAILGQSGLKGYYKLDETGGSTLVDAAPTAHNGTYTGSPTLGQTSGVDAGLGTAVLFDGSSQYGSVASNTDNSITGSTITVECWLKFTGAAAASQFQRVVSKGPNVNGSPFICYGIVVNNGSSRIEFDIVNGSNIGAAAQASFTPTAGVWYHVVGTYNGTTIGLYINGLLNGTAGNTGNILASTQPLMIGASQRGGVVAEYFPGTINDVALYNIELDPQTILQHYLARSVVCPPTATGRSQAVFVG